MYFFRTHALPATCRESLKALFLRQCLSECVYWNCNYHNRIAPLISGASNSFARTVIDVCSLLTKSQCAQWTTQVDCCCPCLCTTNPSRPYSMTHHESECACLCAKIMTSTRCVGSAQISHSVSRWIGCSTVLLLCTLACPSTHTIMLISIDSLVISNRKVLLNVLSLTLLHISLHYFCFLLGFSLLFSFPTGAGSTVVAPNHVNCSDAKQCQLLQHWQLQLDRRAELLTNDTGHQFST